MAFVPEDGTGLANANSLTSTAFFYAYHAERGNAAAAALSEDRVKQLLILATDYVVDLYSPAFAGAKAVTGQALPFPRIIDYVNVGNPIGVQKAVAELALIQHTTPLFPSNVKRGKKRVKIGPLEVEYDGNAPTQTLFVTASLKLSPFLKATVGGAFGMARLQRV